MNKVIVGMSGGVDSSVSAYLLKEQGFEVEGLSFILWEARCRTSSTACCSRESVESAAETAGGLGIRHRAIDVRSEFLGMVIDPFVAAYSRGLTPNPCILCNRHIKFPFLLREAEKEEARFIATGHYARVERGAQGEPFLKKGINGRKDQSYVLYCLSPEELGKLVLPLGEFRKDRVREIARTLGLPAAERPESQEICFIGEGDYGRFVDDFVDPREQGPIIDGQGRIVGTHQGIHRYTVGQRKGLGIASPEPLYVTRIDAERNAVFVGAREDVFVSEVVAKEMHWLGLPGEGRFRAEVKIRSMMEAAPATIEIDGDDVRITFDERQWAPAPGQSAVLYDGERVLGGGIIC